MTRYPWPTRAGGAWGRRNSFEENNAHQFNSLCILRGQQMGLSLIQTTSLSLACESICEMSMSNATSADQFNASKKYFIIRRSRKHTVLRHIYLYYTLYYILYYIIHYIIHYIILYYLCPFKLYYLLKKTRALTSLQLRHLAFNILGLLCKSQLRFDSCDITFTSNKRILIDWLILYI